jgi:SAM-dependent methyltransferase
VGVDLSAAELAVARRLHADGLVRASAAALPLASGSVDVVVCSMALQVLTPLPTALAEIARILTSGGRLVATVPVRGPLRVTDVPVLAGLLATLGRGLGYPNDGLLTRLPDLLSEVGLRLVADQRQRFDYRLADAADADLFLASLYLPELPTRRYQAAQTLLRSLARVGAHLPVPIRRVVATRR